MSGMRGPGKGYTNNPDGHPGGENGRMECPRCGKPQGNLPNHLEVCNGD